MRGRRAQRQPPDGGFAKFSCCAPPPGGMALWVRIDDAVDLEAWATRCLDRDELRRAVTLMAGAL